MKVLIHDYGNYPFTRQLAEAFAARGYSVDYAYSVSTQVLRRNSVGVSTDHLHYWDITLDREYRKYNYLARCCCEIEHGRKLAKLIDEIHPDVVISANTPIDAQRIALIASRRQKAKFIFWMQDVIGLAIKQNLTKKVPALGFIIGEYYTKIERDLVRKSDQIVLISRDFLPLLEGWGIEKNRLNVIPNWAPIASLPMQPKQNPWSEGNGLSDSFCFVYTGILGLKHNPELFLILAESFRNEPDVKIVIVSEGKAADWLRQQKVARNLQNLMVLPFQTAEQYAQVLASADVLMSILCEDAGHYSVPSKVLSYLCACRPLMLAVPPDNLSARIVEENEAGLVCSPQHVAGWIRNAQILFNDRSLANRMAVNARRYAETNFDIDQITDRFEENIQKMKKE